MRHITALSTRRSRVRLAPLSAAMLTALIVSGANAIPTVPDPRHDAPATPWSSVPIGALNPATDQHQHRDTDNLFGVIGKYDTYAAWDDNTYRYNALADRPLSKALDGQDYGHGFMRNPASFQFDVTVPAWARGLINGKVRDLWEANVNQLGAPNVNGVPTETRIDFDEVAAAGDITIKFAATYPVGAAGATVETPFPFDQELDNQGNRIGGGGPGGRDGNLAFWTPSLRQMTFNININWFKDDTGPGGADVPADNINPLIQAGKFDFVSTALHEWGHMIGLDHEGILGDTMFETQGRRGFGGGIVRNIDANTLDGAKDLYTIAIPSPGSAALLGASGLLLIGRRRRHR